MNKGSGFLVSYSSQKQKLIWNLQRILLIWDQVHINLWWTPLRGKKKSKWRGLVSPERKTERFDPMRMHGVFPWTLLSV